jgi:hypothetical protein
LVEHIRALAAAEVRFASGPAISSTAHGHHHAPAAVKIAGKLAEGLIEIVDTAEGERMRFTVARHAQGLRARVTIARPEANPETLPLFPVSGDHHSLMSAIAPAEPHEFSAMLELVAGDQKESLPFSMSEPEHSH